MNKKKSINPLLILLINILFLIYTVNISYSFINWQVSLGGTSKDYAYSIQQTNDSGYIVLGYTYSHDGDVSESHGMYDYWVVKLSSLGYVEWQKSIGGSDYDFAYSIHQTIEGGYILVGWTESFDGDVLGNHGAEDYWVVMLDVSGIIEWQLPLGGSNQDKAYSICPTSDGGYILAGASNSNDGDVSGNHGSYDYWIVKIDSSKAIEWQNSYGGSDIDWANSIQQCRDGGYIIAGWSNSTDGDISSCWGNYDYWILKLDTLGSIEWERSLGGTGDDKASCIQQTDDGGYIIAGWSGSNNHMVSGNHGSYDYWIVKLSTTGFLEWQRSLGGNEEDRANSICQCEDGGYIAGGYSKSNNGNVSGNHGGYDYWIVKLVSYGLIEWQYSLGGSSNDYCYSIDQAADCGYILAGYSLSNDGDVSDHHGDAGAYEDYWVVKLSPYVGIVEEQLPDEFSMSVYPNPFNESTTIVVDFGSLFETKLHSSCRIESSPCSQIEILDINGRLVKVLEYSSVGKEAVTIQSTFSWSPDKSTPSGIYLIRANINNHRVSKKVLYLR